MGKAVSKWVGLFLGLPSSSQHKSDEGAGLWYNQQTAINHYILWWGAKVPNTDCGKWSRAGAIWHNP